MKPFVVAPDPSKLIEYAGAHSYQLFDQENTPIPGSNAMLNLFYSAEYPATPGVHEDNEGFYVIGGTGSIKIEGSEYDLIPGTAILVPAGLHHALRKTGEEDLKVFIYHFPVTKEH
jgi:mannose-6-phosphate isomerase-like protein (cupin superfamily)